jgi:hypothetical protein
VRAAGFRPRTRLGIRAWACKQKCTCKVRQPQTPPWARALAALKMPPHLCETTRAGFLPAKKACARPASKPAIPAQQPLIPLGYPLAVGGQAAATLSSDPVRALPAVWAHAARCRSCTLQAGLCMTTIPGRSP